MKPTAVVLLNVICGGYMPERPFHVVGTIVPVYSRPLEKWHLQGPAELMEFIAHDGNLEYWYVRFLGEKELVKRKIVAVDK